MMAQLPSVASPEQRSTLYVCPIAAQVPELEVFKYPF